MILFRTGLVKEPPVLEKPGWETENKGKSSVDTAAWQLHNVLATHFAKASLFSHLTNAYWAHAVCQAYGEFIKYAVGKPKETFSEFLRVELKTKVGEIQEKERYIGQDMSLYQKVLR